MKLDERIAARARKNYTELLNALVDAEQSKVAALMGVDDSTISRFKGQLEFVGAFLAAVDRKPVEQSAHFMSDTRRKSLCEMAAVGVEALSRTDSEWGQL